MRDGYCSINGTHGGEAGQHGFWDNYFNIYKLLESLPTILLIDDVLTGYAEQGHYTPRGLEAVWPVFRLTGGGARRCPRDSPRQCTRDSSTSLSSIGRRPCPWRWPSATDLMLFRDLCSRLGVSRWCYDKAFEPMIFTGLFAPGAECSAAAALGMAYFFVLKTSTSFDVRWCRGNVGEAIFDPWVSQLRTLGVNFELGRVRGFDMVGNGAIAGVVCTREGKDGAKGDVFALESDEVVFAVGGVALGAMVRSSPEISRHSEFRKFTNLRGTGVLATRLYLDRALNIPYSANVCWGG